MSDASSPRTSGSGAAGRASDVGTPPVDGEDRTPAGRSRRDRPAKAPLSELAVVDAALDILRQDGLDAVTMRRVAAALDTGAASLYVYVGGRDELYVRMLNRVIEGIEVPPLDRARWRDQLMEILHGMLAALESNRGIARVALATIPTGDAALRVSDRMMELLLIGGVEPQAAAWAMDSLSLFVTATAVETIVHGEREDTEASFIAEFVEKMETPGAERFPTIAAHMPQVIGGGGGARFQFGLDTMIDGMLAQAGQPVRRREPVDD